MNPDINREFALGFFVLIPAGFLLIGFGTKQSPIGKFSLACGIVALFSFLVFPVVVLALPFNVGFAVPELVESLVLLIS